ncbi:MAG: alanine:cation symporter family protein, partial [Muribaculaceae bacterium]|nr:alanine:cation symporter family protein [Muribaculaceae bacterium]
DTVIVCALTGIVIVSSIIAYPEIDYSDGVALTRVAFSKIPIVGRPLLTFGLMTFTFSTILGWSYYGERAMEYLFGKKSRIFYRVVYIVMVFVGAVVSLQLVWNIADCVNALMAIPNLVALLLLSGVAARETRRYLWSNHLDDLADDEFDSPQADLQQ